MGLRLSISFTILNCFVPPFITSTLIRILFSSLHFIAFNWFIFCVCSFSWMSWVCVKSQNCWIFNRLNQRIGKNGQIWWLASGSIAQIPILVSVYQRKWGIPSIFISSIKPIPQCIKAMMFQNRGWIEAQIPGWNRYQTHRWIYIQIQVKSLTPKP